MLVIRLSKGGAKKRPFYHIVVADRRRSRDGRSVERLGLYNPLAKEHEERIRIEMERLQYWVSQGAQPSDRVRTLMGEYANPALVKGRTIIKPVPKVKPAEAAAPAADGATEQ